MAPTARTICSPPGPLAVKYRACDIPVAAKRSVRVLALALQSLEDCQVHQQALLDLHAASRDHACLIENSHVKLTHTYTLLACVEAPPVTAPLYDLAGDFKASAFDLPGEIKKRLPSIPSAEEAAKIQKKADDVRDQTQKQLDSQKGPLGRLQESSKKQQ